MRARLLFLALAVAAASLVGGCTDNDPYGLKDLPQQPSQASTPATATGESAKVAPAKLGQPASVGTWLIVASGASRVGKIGEVTAKKGEELLMVTVELSNGGALDTDTHPDYFTLVGPDGTEHKAVKIEDPDFIHTTRQPILAGEARDIYIAFSVKEGDGPFQLQYLPLSEERANQPAALDIE